MVFLVRKEEKLNHRRIPIHSHSLNPDCLPKRFPLRNRDDRKELQFEIRVIVAERTVRIRRTLTEPLQEELVAGAVAVPDVGALRQA